ncbi:MAG: hypothetical protein ACR2Q4_21860 [Geminicoccaceae bacterium]
MASTIQLGDNITRIEDDGAGAGKILLTVLGVVLVLAGAGMLLYLGTVIIDILQEPSEVKLVAMVFDQIQVGDRAFFGNIGESQFAFSLGEPLRTMLFVIVILWILGAFANIIKAIIGAGRDLIVAGQQD